MKKLLPLIVLVLFASLGLTAGKFLQPAPPETEEVAAEDAETPQVAEAKNETTGTSGSAGRPVDYVKMNNQFVVPIVENERVAALIVLSLSIEVPEGKQEDVLRKEPKIRDSFLQVLFTHANLGGFSGEFTQPVKLNSLRRSLLEVAQRDIGKELAYDVLILEIARQDY